jgi:hypothetical protein
MLHQEIRPQLEYFRAILLDFLPKIEIRTDLFDSENIAFEIHVNRSPFWREWAGQ